MLKKTFHIGRGYGMIAFKRRLERSSYPTSKEVVMKALITKTKKRKGKNFTKKDTIMKDINLRKRKT